MSSHKEVIESSGATGTITRGVNSVSPSKNAAADGQWCPTNILLKRRRRLARRDDDKLLQHQGRRKRTWVTQSPTRENMTECFEFMGKQIQTLQREIRLLQSRVAELEFDSGDSDRKMNRSHLCPVLECGKSFSRHLHLRRHIKDESSHAHREFASTLDRTFCDLCQKPFNRPEDYTRHEKRAHLGVFQRRHAWTNLGSSEHLTSLNILLDEDFNIVNSASNR